MSIDLLFSVTVIQNIPDRLSLIEEMKRVGRRRAVLSVLKKAITKDKFCRLLKSAQLSSFKILDSGELKDWIAYLIL
jgi:ubiquinone/menaquinone biosynthesis C-methylase UbiE